MVVAVRRPRAIVFDILGTASKSGFLERILFPFLKTNLDAYISSHWNRREFLRLYNKILDQSVELHSQEASTPLVLAHESPEARASLMNFINFVAESGANAPAVTQLRFKVWFEGYQQNKLRTPIYSDVPNRVRQWFAEGVKFYVFSNTWVAAQKALLQNTDHGDLTHLISGHFDNDFGLLTEPDTWRRLCNELREQAQDVLFLTKSPLEGRAASEAGLGVVLVLTHRHNVKAVSHEDRHRFPYVRTLNDLVWLDQAELQAPSAASEAAGAGASVTGAAYAGAQRPNSVTGAQNTLDQPGPLATAISAPSAAPASVATSVEPASSVAASSSRQSSHKPRSTSQRASSSTATSRPSTGSSRPASSATSKH